MNTRRLGIRRPTTTPETPVLDAELPAWEAWDTIYPRKAADARKYLHYVEDRDGGHWFRDRRDDKVYALPTVERYRAGQDPARLAELWRPRRSAFWHVTGVLLLIVGTLALAGGWLVFLAVLGIGLTLATLLYALRKSGFAQHHRDPQRQGDVRLPLFRSDAEKSKIARDVAITAASAAYLAHQHHEKQEKKNRQALAEEIVAAQRRDQASAPQSNAPARAWASTPPQTDARFIPKVPQAPLHKW